MGRRTVTWAGLAVTDAERNALRRAGFTPAGLAERHPLDLVTSTDESIDEDRALHLTARSGLLGLMTPAKADMLAELGVADRRDLACRTAEELFVLYQDVSPYTHPAVYDRLATLIELAKGSTGERTTVEWWRRRREREGVDLVRLAWQRRFGPGPEERATAWSLRVPALRLQANVAVGSRDARGGVRPSFQPDVVTADDGADPRFVVGHWKWAGRNGAFLRLEELAAGDAVELRDGRTHFRYAVEEVRCGLVEDARATQRYELTLTTPPHLRWPQSVSHWDLPRDFDGRHLLTVTVSARRTD